MLDPTTGDVVWRATVQWVWFQPHRSWLGQPRTFDLRVVAFAHRIAFYEDAAGFEAGQDSWWPRINGRAMPDGKPMRFPPNAFIPEGLFGTGENVGLAAMALLAGTVETVGPLTNRLTGQKFLHVRLAGPPGPVDLVTDAPEGTRRQGTSQMPEHGWSARQTPGGDHAGTAALELAWSVGPRPELTPDLAPPGGRREGHGTRAH